MNKLEKINKPVNSNLEKAAKFIGQKLFPDENNIWARPNYEAKAAEYAFKAGAQWQKEQIIDKAFKYINYQLNLPSDFEQHFRKAMEE